MTNTISVDDRDFLRLFNSHEIGPDDFPHRAHLRLAYIFLVLHGADQGVSKFRDSLQAFLGYHRIDPSKYHETLTQAWILAVSHFMEIAGGHASAEAFIQANPAVLDPQIMRTHYSSELLASDQARNQFVEPDLEPIPRHGA